jgi:hypothetical protein
MRHVIFRGLALALPLLCGAASAQAGPLLYWWGNPDRGVQPGAVVPYGGAPFSHRYGYGAPTDFIPVMPVDQFAYLEYLDRVDRAEKFGYPIPPNPFVRRPVCVPCGK